MMAARDDAGGGTGSARRRRQRRLRSHLRHERLAVVVALAESTHHSAQRQKTARAGREERDALHGHVPEAPLPQDRVLRHVVGHLPVPALGVPVPQMVDQLPDIEQFFRALSPDPEQVIEVPKILPLDVPMRAALRVTQLVEQLVEVPTTVYYSSLFQRTVEQHVDIPVPGGSGGPSSGLQGFSSGQRSTASPSRKRISERIVEQIVDPVSRGRLQGSSSSHSPAGVEERADEPGKGGFRTILQNQKSAKLASHSQAELEEARAEVRREHLSKRKRKKKRKRKLPRNSSRPRLAARHLGRYGSDGLFCCDTVTKSVARAVRTWKPGQSTSPGMWQLLVRCSSCLIAVVDFSGNSLLDLFLCSALFGLTMDTCVCQSTKAWGLLVAMHLALCCPRRTGILDYLGDGVYFSSVLCIWKSLVRAFA